MMIIYFWFLLFLLYLYPFVFYPLILYVLIWFKMRFFGIQNNMDELDYKIKLDRLKLPSVSLIISAYNEENVIEEKLFNSIKLRYPKEKLEIIVVSDGSTDRTDEIVKKFFNKGVTLIRVEGRQGKTACQNIAVEKAKGEIIVFSDANTIYEEKAIEMLITPLVLYPDVGCVSGKLTYISKSAIRKEGLYWRYELLLKKMESTLYSGIGVPGAIYALRKTDYVPLKSDLISDFVEPLEILRLRKKVTKHCGFAEGYEYEPSKDVKKSLSRKRRIFVRAIRGLLYEKELLNPIKYPVASFELISHKIFRWIAPIIGIFMMIVPLFDIKAMLLIFVAEYVAVLGAIMGNANALKKLPNKIAKFIGFLNYFFLLNIADLLGWIDLIKGRKYITWRINR